MLHCDSRDEVPTSDISMQYTDTVVRLMVSAGSWSSVYSIVTPVLWVVVQCTMVRHSIKVGHFSRAPGISASYWENPVSQFSVRKLRFPEFSRKNPFFPTFCAKTGISGENAVAAKTGFSLLDHAEMPAC